jgi:prepilin-type N-terminal cleavage/methylation domain-containing protein
MKKRHQPKASKSGFTLAEVLIAVAIFVIAIFAILKMVSQSMSLVRSIQLQRPDLGTLAGKTMMDSPQTGEGGDVVSGLASGLSTPDDEDFGGNNGGSIALYPDAKWERYLDPIDATNGLYRATITVFEENKDGTESEFTLNFLLFRPDLAEQEMGSAQ